MILRNEVEFAVGYSEPNAGSDAASMRLKARAQRERDGKRGWMLNGQKTWTTSAHFAEWYWLGTRTDPNDKHRGITLMLVPLDQPGVTINAIETMGGAPMGDERTNEVFIEDVFVPDEYVVGEVEPRASSTSRRRSTSSASRCSRSRRSSSASTCCATTCAPPSATASRCARTR